ncbi:hypothetical protein ABZ656_29505 [Streptomyces sp. NPDC007095]|uniref:hypothetical protein n=1 Tax=Streptomyces sp. NPDC007095 TaxID=3154482 RepID=UPI0033CA7D9E
MFSIHSSVHSTPACHPRLRTGVPELSELVQAQTDTTGFVVLHRWAEILERHFPPELPDPDHATE